MATLVELITSGHIRPWEVALTRRQVRSRGLYLLPSPLLISWLKDDLPALASCWNIEETPMQQLDAFTKIFVAGETLTYTRHFNPLVHHGAGVWELKTADVRLFGWFPHRDCFVCGRADHAERVKQYDLYAGYAGEVVRDRDALPLNDPKFVPGDDPHAVVSAFDYP